jgi:hypothetical protein
VRAIDSASLQITGYAPIVLVPTTVTPGYVDLTISAYAPLAGISHQRDPGSVDLTISTFDPTFSLDQHARPSQDLADGFWQPSTGGADLVQMINSEVDPDSDYIYAEASTECELKLGEVTDPFVSSGHVLKYRIKRDPAATSMVVKLYCGNDLITSWTHNDTPFVFTTYERTLTAEQADAITNYADIRLRVEVL